MICFASTRCEIGRTATAVTGVALIDPFGRSRAGGPRHAGTFTMFDRRSKGHDHTVSAQGVGGNLADVYLEQV